MLMPSGAESSPWWPCRQSRHPLGGLHRVSERLFHKGAVPVRGVGFTAGAAFVHLYQGLSGWEFIYPERK